MREKEEWKVKGKREKKKEGTERENPVIEIE